MTGVLETDEVKQINFVTDDESRLDESLNGDAAIEEEDELEEQNSRSCGSSESGLGFSFLAVSKWLNDCVEGQTRCGEGVVNRTVVVGA